MFRTVLISVTFALVILVSMFIIVFIPGGHYFLKRRRKSANKNDRAPSNPTIKPLDMKKNVAYIDLDPE